MQTNLYSVQSTGNRGVISNLVKRLVTKQAALARQATSEQLHMHTLQHVNVSKHTQDRVGNFYPLRIFYPIANLLQRKGFIRISTLKDELSKVNSKSAFVAELSSLKSDQSLPNKLKLNPVILAQCLRWCLALLFPNGVPLFEPVRDINVILDQINWQANSGYPNCCRKSAVRSEYTGLLRKWLDRGLSLRAALAYPLLIFNRVQVKNGLFKRRVVFGYPFIFTMVEHFFYLPIIASLRDNRVIIVGKTQKELSEIALTTKGFYTYSIDFSKFDRRVLPVWIYTVFELIRELLNLDEYESKELDYVRRYFAFSRFYHPEFGQVNRTRGVPSGSSGTNLIDSLLNLVITSYVLTSEKYTSRVHTLLIHGDDIVIVAKQPVNVKRVSDELEKLGMKVTHDPLLDSQPGVSKLHFLGSLWQEGLPNRDLLTMCYQAATVSKFLDRADSLSDAVEGRIYTIFGFDCRLPFLWRKLGFQPFPGRRIFLYTEAFQGTTLGTGPPRGSQYVVGRSDEWSYR